MIVVKVVGICHSNFEVLISDVFFHDKLMGLCR